MRDEAKTICGLVLIVLLTAGMACFLYYNEPIGDDVLTRFDGALTYYLDNATYETGKRITLEKIPDLLRFTWANWSGRMPGYLALYVSGLFPALLRAALGALLFAGNCLLASRLLYGSFREVPRHPLFFVLLFLTLYWYRRAVYYTYMRTMICVYSFPILLILGYLNAGRMSGVRGLRKDVRFWLFQALGLLAGWGHEVLSLMALAVIGTRWLQGMLDGTQSFRSIFRHTGLLLGYVLCFFAPGNFSRMGESHDQSVTPFAGRLLQSVKIHVGILLGANWKLNAVLLACSLLLLSALLFRIWRRGEREKIRRYLADIAPYAAGGAVSVVVWGVMNHVAVYGMDLWIVFACLSLFKTFGVCAPEMKRIVRSSLAANAQKCALIAAALAVLIPALLCFRELAAYIGTARERKRLIQEAVSQRKQEVVVPAYPSWLPEERYCLSYRNDQKQFDTDYYIAFFGTRIVIEEGWMANERF